MQALLKDIEGISTLTRFGRVARIEGLAVEVTGAQGAVSLGGQYRITIRNNKKIPCEVVGFRDGRALVMPLGPLDGITLGARADFEDSPASIYPSRGWLGRVVNGFGEAMDGKGPLPQGTQPYPIKASPPDAMRRGRVGRKLDLGIRALNAFATCCAGQRMGIFAGSGVGKSTLMSMLARNSDGSITSSTSALYPGYALNVTGDTTQRGGTGMSFTQIFGIGANAQSTQASGFSLTAALSANPSRLGFASPAITSSSTVGSTIVSAGDNAGAIALQNAITRSQNFGAAGGIASQAASLSDYAATFYQNLSTQSNSVTVNRITQADRRAEAQSRLTSNSGVNLDEELMVLASYQQAYAAGARILSVVDQLYQTLLKI